MSTPHTNDDDESRMLFQPSFLSKESYGLFLISIFGLCYALMGTFIQLAVSTGLSHTELVVFRSVMQGFVVVVSMCFVAAPPAPTQKNADFEYRAQDDTTDAVDANPKRVLLIQQPFGTGKLFPIVFTRGAIGGIGLLLHFFTLASIPLGDAASLLGLSPVITVVASSFLLGEKFTFPVLAAAFSTVIGSVLIAKPTLLFGSHEDGQVVHNRLGYISGMFGSCTASAAVMLVRMAGTTGGVHTLQLLFSWSFFGTLYAILKLVFWNHETLSWPSSFTAYTYVSAMCIVGVIGHFCMNYGGQFAPAGSSSIVRASLMLWGYFFEVLVFGQVPDGYTAMGAILILASVGAVAWQKYQITQEDKSTEMAHVELESMGRKMT